MTKHSKRRQHKSNRASQLFILAGFAALVLAFLVFKENPQADATTASNVLAEAQLDQALEAGEPVLAFFHSTTCDLCIIMMDTVAQVFPKYHDAVTLIDVNVYDEHNQSLLRRVRLQYIPTLIFIDENGQLEQHIGVMEAAQLSSKLAALAGEP